MNGQKGFGGFMREARRETSFLLLDAAGLTIDEERELGRKAGRARRPIPEGASETLQEGWVVGDAEADAAENDDVDVGGRPL